MNILSGQKENSLEIYEGKHTVFGRQVREVQQDDFQGAAAEAGDAYIFGENLHGSIQGRTAWICRAQCDIPSHPQRPI